MSLKIRLFDHFLKEGDGDKKVRKGAWRMPWVLEAMKDVISCDKLRGSANTN